MRLLLIRHALPNAIGPAMSATLVAELAMVVVLIPLPVLIVKEPDVAYTEMTSSPLLVFSVSGPAVAWTEAVSLPVPVSILWAHHRPPMAAQMLVQATIPEERYQPFGLGS